MCTAWRYDGTLWLRVPNPRRGDGTFATPTAASKYLRLIEEQYSITASWTALTGGSYPDWRPERKWWNGIRQAAALELEEA